MAVTVVAASGFLWVATSGRGQIPTRTQSVAEMAYEFIANMLRDSAGAKGMVKTIMDGKDKRIGADVSYSPKFIYDAIKLTAEARLKGEKLPATTIIPSVLITKENAKDFYHPNSPF